MNIVESKVAEDVLKIYVPENILNLKPIIAGGFVVSLYQHIILKSSPEFNEKLEAFLSENNSSFLSQAKPLSERLKEVVGKSKDSNKEPLSFGDIDIWFQKDNEIWQESHPFHFLISKLQPDEPVSKITSFILAGVTNVQLPQASNDNYYPKTYFTESKNLQQFIQHLGLSPHHGVRSSSYWANTFYTNGNNYTYSVPIQMVRKPQNNIGELFASFDILNCCAAYHDGKFYFADGFEEAFQSRILEKGKRFERATIQDKIWVANRAFKYAKRYNLEFSKDICEDIIQTFIDGEEFVSKLKNGQELDQVVKTNEIQFEDGYGQVISRIDKETFLSIATTTFSNFSSLISMKHFNNDCIFLFLNSKDPSIIHEVKKFIELQEKLLRGETESKEVSRNENYGGFF